ncbi:LOW QUALITY PROTEIN: uncharacterized protein LOC129585843 [Paramacrobiotus metropolitanus]|uniref:LOW QUALITY PROTEIN: uncharacterized protein LOC129585843 n=1 Tax=Paramacrobiotus metropolitanus TaxID=2943436 RepID=UPI002445BE7A|nr:LOW QUALITY PROTEIN: uncharacterized protein LOC129585843 [Paramacrobiotus metropolitanus]
MNLCHLFKDTKSLSPSSACIKHTSKVVHPSTVNFRITDKSKRVHFGCEICGREPKLMCTGCSETYYCCPKHCILDFHAIHKYVCTKIKVIRNPDCKSEIWKRFTTEEVNAILQGRKHMVLKLANNMAHRNLHRGNYLFAIPCSLLSQKLTLELFGDLYCLEMVGPYLTMAAAYLARKKLKKSQFYCGLVNHVKLAKLHGRLPKNEELQLQILTARQYVEEGNFGMAMNILTEQVAELSFDRGSNSQELLDGLFYLGYCCFVSHNIVSANAYYCYIFSTVLLNDLTKASLLLHQAIEEQLNPLIKPGMKMGDEHVHRHSSPTPAPYSERAYQVYLQRECLLTYLRTIWKQFEMANKKDFPDIFPMVHYCIAIILYACNQWKEASDYYREAERLTGNDRAFEFQQMRKPLTFLKKHVDYCLTKHDVTMDEQPAKKQNSVTENQPATDTTVTSFDDELGETLKQLAAKIRSYEMDLALHNSDFRNNKVLLHYVGVL